MQFLREKNFKQTIPEVKIRDGETISCEKAIDGLKRATRLYSSLQAIDGHWPSQMTGALYIHPPLVSHPSILTINILVSELEF